MPFKNKEQKRKCYQMNDPNWDCEEYAKGEDGEEEDKEEEEEKPSFKTYYNRRNNE